MNPSERVFSHLAGQATQGLIASRRRKDRVREELAAHLAEDFESQIASGRSDEESLVAVRERFGDYSGAPLTDRSPRAFLVAERR